MSREVSVTDADQSVGLDSTPAADAQPIPAPSGIGSTLLSFPTFLAGSLAYVVFLFSRRNIADPDLWWHLRNAQHLLTTGHLPLVDSYSYTALGAPVLPFEWLAEIPYYLAYKWAGLPGVFLLVFLLCTAISLGVFRLSYVASHDVKNSFLPTLGAALLALVSIGARTLLFGWLYLVVLLLILEEVRSGRLKWLWLLPPLFCLWINSHGSWPMGMLVFGIFIASGFVEGSWGQAYATRWSGQQLRALLVTAGASAVAVFVNPLGHRLVLYPFKVMFAAGKGVGIIQEFASIDFQTSTGKVAMLVILGTLLVAILSSERWRLDELAFTMLALYYSLTYIRFLFLAGILLAPVFAKRVKVMAPYDEKSDKRHYNAIALAVLLCLFIVAATRQFKFQNPIKYPDGAIAYMQSHGIRSNVFHEWVWGGYLMWRMPELKVFIDGRGEPYGPTGVVGDYLSAASNENSQAVLDKYHVEYVLMPADSPLAISLKSSRAWTVRYSDEDSVLLYRSPTS